MKNLILLLFLVGLGFCTFPKNEKVQKLKTIEHKHFMGTVIK